MVWIHFFCEWKDFIWYILSSAKYWIEYFELFRKSFTAINNKFDKVFLVVDFNLPNFEWFNQVRLSSETIYWNVYELYKWCMSYPSKQLSYT